MNTPKKIAVLGGTGRTGHFVIEQLLLQHYQPRILLRDRKKLTIQNELIGVVEGDALNPSSIKTCLEDCRAVINIMGQRKGEPLVAFKAQENLLNAMASFKIERYIVLAGINLDAPGDNKGPDTQAATSWMAEKFPDIQRDRQNALNRLIATDQAWTMVRVPMISFTCNNGTAIVSLEDCEGTSVTASVIASFLVSLLESEDYSKACPFLWSN